MHACGISSPRPDFYPPAYEDGLGAEKQACLTGGGPLDLPPPLYTETILELEDGNDAQPEAPPSYQQCMGAAGATATAENAERPRATLSKDVSGTALQHSELTSC